MMAAAVLHALPDGFGDKLYTLSCEIEQLYALPPHVGRDRAELVARRLRQMARFPRP